MFVGVTPVPDQEHQGLRRKERESVRNGSVGDQHTDYYSRGTKWVEVEMVGVDGGGDGGRGEGGDGDLEGLLVHLLHGQAAILGEELRRENSQSEDR